LFHADEDAAPMVAEVDREPYQFVGVRDVVDRSDGADADVDASELVDRDRGLDRCRGNAHQELLLAGLVTVPPCTKRSTAVASGCRAGSLESHA
jgi:hypothetical protein